MTTFTDPAPVRDLIRANGRFAPTKSIWSYIHTSTGTPSWASFTTNSHDMYTSSFVQSAVLLWTNLGGLTLAGHDFMGTSLRSAPTTRPQ